MADSTKKKICRLCSLSKFGGVLLGRDLAGIFKNGHVYEVYELMGEIMFKDLGEHALPSYGTTGRLSWYMTSGVIMLTKEEYEKEKELNG